MLYSPSVTDSWRGLSSPLQVRPRKVAPHYSERYTLAKSSSTFNARRPRDFSCRVRGADINRADARADHHRDCAGRASEYANCASDRDRRAAHRDRRASINADARTDCDREDYAIANGDANCDAVARARNRAVRGDLATRLLQTRRGFKSADESRLLLHSKSQRRVRLRQSHDSRHRAQR